MVRNSHPPYQPPRWRASATARRALTLVTLGGLLALVLAVGAWVL